MPTDGTLYVACPAVYVHKADHSRGLDFSKTYQRRGITSSPPSLSCACLCAACASHGCQVH